jgi:hypothetical protein
LRLHLPDAGSQQLDHTGLGATFHVRPFDIPAPANRALHQQLHVPAGTPLRGAVALALGDRRYSDFLIEIIGLDPPAAGVPLDWPAKPPATGSFRLNVRRLRAYIRSSSMFAELIWIPGTEANVQDSIAHMPRQPSPHEIAQAVRALNTLKDLAPLGGEAPS